jgi:hypothetical protein
MGLTDTWSDVDRAVVVNYGILIAPQLMQRSTGMKKQYCV